MDKNLKRTHKKDFIQIKVGFLMALAVILLTATCYLSYRNLSSIVSSIRINVNPQMKLLSIREISMDLEKAENSVRLFAITRNPADIKPYYQVVSLIDKKVNRLRDQCRNDSVLLRQTNDIGKLIGENIRLWNKFLILYRDDNVTEYLKKLSEQLDSVSAANQKKEKGILRRVFSPGNKTQVDDQTLRSDINRVVQEDSLARFKIIARESQLAATGSELKSKFYDLITKMENEVTGLISSKAESADRVAGKTYLWLILLSVSGGLLAVTVLFIIIRYVRKAYAYQAALENSKSEAEKLARTKELFMANMSHEIRTPVTAISGFTEQLLHEHHGESVDRSLNIIKSSSDHLLKIIDDILDFSKLQNSKLSLEKVDFSIRSLMEEVYNLFGKQAQQNNTTLSYSIDRDTPQVLLGDPYRLRQIMINLVGNSVKFTKNGSVSFSVRSIAGSKDHIDLMMEFSDTGIGIDESKLNLVFEDFTQAEMSTTRKYGGTGLGLSIVKKLVDLHGGTIEIKSRRNQGTNIVCRIPLQKGISAPPQKGTGSSRQMTAELTGLKVLVVDDEEYNRLLFRKILERWNMVFSEAVNGMDALELLKENRYDILFMDMLMPGLDGFNTAIFIRQEMKITEKEMPVVFISAAPLGEEWDKFRKAGINAFLRKPFTEERLLRTILEILGKSNPVTDTVTSGNEAESTPEPVRVNLENLNHIAAGDTQFVRQMVESFEATTRRGLNDILEAAGSDQWDKIAENAHRLLPPCRHLGAMDLFNLLHEIEHNARNRVNTGSVKILAEKSRKEFENVCEAIAGQLAKMS